MQVRLAILTYVNTLKRDFTGITYDAVEAAFVGFCYSESTSGQVGFSISIRSSFVCNFAV